MRSRSFTIRVWSVLASGLSLLYVGVPCTERLRTSVITGSKSLLAQLLDPSTLLPGAFDQQAGGNPP